MNPTLTDWQGRSVWLIGASSGIGLATAKALHAAGARVFVSARNAELLQQFVDAHPGSQAVVLDVCDTAAIAQAANWRDNGLQLPVRFILDVYLLQHPDFVAHLRQVLARHPQLRPGDVELEVLESSAIEDLTRANAVMTQCAALGVGFALDDFGTGYSSLTYLRKLPFDLLKIDQSFVRDMLKDAEDLGIVEGVIRLAAAFDRSVIAEGVETLEHGAKLLQLGCSLAQGYGIARPMPPEHFVEWASRWISDKAWLHIAG